MSSKELKSVIVFSGDVTREQFDSVVPKEHEGIVIIRGNLDYSCKCPHKGVCKKDLVLRGTELYVDQLISTSNIVAKDIFCNTIISNSVTADGMIVCKKLQCEDIKCGSDLFTESANANYITVGGDFYYVRCSSMSIDVFGRNVMMDEF